MFSLTKLTAAVAQLAANLTQLASTVAEVNQGIRGRLALDNDPAEALDGPEVQALPGPAEKAAGRNSRKVKTEAQ
jgi:hypothetical protein